jgi:putative transposase
MDDRNKALETWAMRGIIKRVYRLYCSLKLNKRRKGKKRLPTRTPAPLQVPQGLLRHY